MSCGSTGAATFAIAGATLDPASNIAGATLDPASNRPLSLSLSPVTRLNHCQSYNIHTTHKQFPLIQNSSARILMASIRSPSSNIISPPDNKRTSTCRVQYSYGVEYPLYHRVSSVWCVDMYRAIPGEGSAARLPPRACCVCRRCSLRCGGWCGLPRSTCASTRSMASWSSRTVSPRPVMSGIAALEVAR